MPKMKKELADSMKFQTGFHMASWLEIAEKIEIYDLAVMAEALETTMAFNKQISGLPRDLSMSR